MSTQPNLQNALIPMEKVASDLKLPVVDAVKLARIYNGVKPAGENKIRLQTIRNEQFITNGEAEKVKTFFETKLVDINALERATGVPFHHIKTMCDKCSDDRISALLPDAAKVRPIVLNGTYYFDNKYINKFQDRMAQFNDIIDIVEEKANSIEQEIEDEFELARQMQERQKQEETSEEINQSSDEEFEDEDDYDDFDEIAAEEEEKEKAKKKKELQKKKEAEFRKEIEKGAEEYKKQTEAKRVENEKRAEAAQELLKKQAESTAEMLKRQEENARLYREHTEKVQNAVGDKYSSTDENMIAQMRENQEKYRREQEQQMVLAETARKTAEESARANEALEKSREESKRLADEAKRMEDARKVAENARTEADRQKIAEESRRAEDEARRANESARRAEEEARRASAEADRLREQVNNQSGGSNSLAEQERARKMQEDLNRAENEARQREETSRKAQEDATRRAEEARRAEENHRAAEAYRTEEGRKRFEEQSKRAQEEASRAETATREKAREARQLEEFSKMAESQYKEFKPTVESPTAYRENIISQASQEAQRITEDYKKAQEDYQRANRRVEECSKYSQQVVADLEAARRNNETQRVAVLTEEAKKASENLARAASESAMYSVTASALETSKNAAEATLKAAEEARKYSENTEKLEAEYRRNLQSMVRLQEQLKEYSTPPATQSSTSTPSTNNEFKKDGSTNGGYSVVQDISYNTTQPKAYVPQNIQEPPKDAPQHIKDTYETYKKLVDTQVNISSQIKDNIAKTEEAMSRTTESSGKLKETHEVVSNYIYTQQVDAVEGVNKRMGELNEHRTALYGNDNKGFTRVEVPQQQMYGAQQQTAPTSEVVKAQKMDPVIIKDGNGSAAVTATGRDYQPTPQSPTITSGGTGTPSKSDKITAMKDAMLGATVIKDTTASPNANMATGVIDYGSYKVTYTYDKANAADFQKFANSVTATRLDAQNNGKEAPKSSDFPPDARFKPTQITRQNGETQQLDEKSVRSNARIARSNTLDNKLDSATAPSKEAVAMANKAYTKIDLHGLVNNAVKNVEGTAGRYMANTQTFNGLTKGYRAAKGTVEVLNMFVSSGQNYRNTMMDVSKFVATDGQKGRMARYNTNGMNPQAIFFRGARNHQGMDFDKMNDILKKHNKENGTSYKMLDSTMGLSLKRGKVSMGSKELQALMKNNKIADLSKLSASDFDKLIAGTKDKKLIKELTAHKKLNALLAEKGGIANMGDKQIAKMFENLKNQKGGAGMRKALATRTNVRGFGNDFDGSVKRNTPRKMWMRRATGKNEAILMDFIAKNTKLGNIEQLKKMSSKQLMALLKNKDLNADAKEAIKMLAAHRHLGESFAASMRKKGVKQLQQSLRRTSQSNESMAGYYQIKDAVGMAKGAVVNTYKIGAWIIRKLGINKTRWARAITNASDAAKKWVQDKAKALKDKIKAKTTDKLKKGAKKLRRKTSVAINNRARKLLGNKRYVGLRKGLRKLASPFKALGKAFNEMAKLLKLLLNAIRAVLDALKAVLHYIIIGIAIVIGVILLTNFLMYSVGTIGGMITSFFENLWSEDIMESTAGTTLNDLIAYDEVFYKELNSFAEKAKKTELVALKETDASGNHYMGSFLASVGCPETYGFINPNAGKYGTGGVPYNEEGGFLWFGGRDEYRYRINNPGDPYGCNGYEQHYYNKAGQEIARYSNAKDILSIAYAGFDGKVNILEQICPDGFGLTYGDYCDELWDVTHYCLQPGCSQNIDVGHEWTWVQWPDWDFWIKLWIPAYEIKEEANVHCHTTNVYPCEGDCTKDGTYNSYTYYCNNTATGNFVTDAQKQTHWVYTAKKYNGETDINPKSYGYDSAKLCVIDGDTKKSGWEKEIFKDNNGGKGCTTIYCTNNAGSFVEYSTQSGVKKDVNGNKIGHNIPQGTKPNTTTKIDCDNYNFWTCAGCWDVSHSAKEVNNGTCTCSKWYHGYYVYSDGYGHNEEYYNASYSKPSGCTNSETKYIYEDCYSYDNPYIEYKGTWYDENGTDRGTDSIGYDYVYDYYTATCSHKVKTETVTLYVNLVYTDSGDDAGYLVVEFDLYECAGQKTKVYVCKGECGGYQVCGGHASCKGHYTCTAGHNLRYCLGHVKAYSKIAIIGINDNGVFNLAKTGGRDDVIARISKSETQDFARSIYDGDWADLYNISFQRSLTVAIQLSDSEQALLIGRNAGKGEVNVVNMALLMVGRVAYHGEFTTYTNTGTSAYKIENAEDCIKVFNGVTKEPDIKGRMKPGLTETSYVQHVFYCAQLVDSYKPNDLSNFLGNFKPTTKDKLEPGDIIITKLGDGTIKDPVIYIRTISPDKFLVARCSDGNSSVIYDNVFAQSTDVYYTFNN